MINIKFKFASEEQNLDVFTIKNLPLYGGTQSSGFMDTGLYL